METVRAINHKMYAYLRADTTLTDLMGNSNIQEGLAVRSDTFPYIVYALDPSITPDTPVVANCGFQLDIWDKPTNGLTTRIFEVRGRLVKLLDQHTFTLDGGEAKGIRVYLDSMGPVLRDPDVEFLFHIVMLCTLRYVRSGDLVYD